MIKPYYDHKGIVIYNCDCLEIMPELEPVDLCLTDPPYPGLKGGTDFYGKGVAPIRHKSTSIGEPWSINLDDWTKQVDRISKLGAMIFCSYHFLEKIPSLFLMSKVCLFTWYKRNSPLPVNNVPRFTTEFVWCLKKIPGLTWKKIETMKDIPSLPAGCMATERIRNVNGTTAHPTQKPLKLIKYLLGVGGESILDPFLGTGTTLVAAKELGRKEQSA